MQVEINTTKSLCASDRNLTDRAKVEVVSVINNAKEDFLTSTTFHGLSYIHGSKSMYRRVIWALLFLVSTICLLVSLYLSLEKYLLYKTIVSTTITRSTELEFPAMTICNLNYFRKSKIVDGPLKHFLDHQSDADKNKVR